MNKSIYTQYIYNSTNPKNILHITTLRNNQGKEFGTFKINAIKNPFERHFLYEMSIYIHDAIEKKRIF